MWDAGCVEWDAWYVMSAGGEGARVRSGERERLEANACGSRMVLSNLSDPDAARTRTWQRHVRGLDAAPNQFWGYLRDTTRIRTKCHANFPHMHDESTNSFRVGPKMDTLGMRFHLAIGKRFHTSTWEVSPSGGETSYV